MPLGPLAAPAMSGERPGDVDARCAARSASLIARLPEGPSERTRARRRASRSSATPSTRAGRRRGVAARQRRLRPHRVRSIAEGATRMADAGLRRQRGPRARAGVRSRGLHASARAVRRLRSRSSRSEADGDGARRRRAYPCPACGATLYGWTAAHDPLDRGKRIVLDRCENCGLSVTRGARPRRRPGGAGLAARARATPGGR